MHQLYCWKILQFVWVIPELSYSSTSLPFSSFLKFPSQSHLWFPVDSNLISLIITTNCGQMDQLYSKVSKHSDSWLLYLEIQNYFDLTWRLRVFCTLHLKISIPNTILHNTLEYIVSQKGNPKPLQSQWEPLGILIAEVSFTVTCDRGLAIEEECV